MKLIVGLGNPGTKFVNTRHNVGFAVVDSFLSQNKYQILKEDKTAHIYQINFNQHQSLLIKPQTYMNLSGEVVKKNINKYRIKIENILVIVDDIYLDEGKLKLKMQGGHGGHNGLRNIIDRLGTKQFKRLKIGVSLDSCMPLDQYLLTPVNASSQKNILKNIHIINKIIFNFIQDVDFNILMNGYNSKL
ncbi:aminoacyl-tRNA hydrolase [Paulownia witches'-broom phytoplasma]|uniref:Peptidyl-tRNA hydrolase n=1 Tax=Paulownia witches'-broom phytoplasma TaxID=39647 RepID=A0ABX8TNY3_9MOLU|nr:aminoacyl-tRNA hydrolase [Paulownia witches'-broom phytoplasma]QYC30952.1 aminoacyl-tRNA hydrolase [Paulownia witches'-broom phytoplasma]GLH60629.1 peptidyl-tRNA hydrolase [Paulownia witches'-broom phytoplasma]